MIRRAILAAQPGLPSERIARQLSDAVPAAFNAAVRIFVHKAKTGSPETDLAKWAGIAERLSAFLFKETLEIDPLGISPRDEIHDLRPDPVFSVLKDWSLSTLRL